MTDNGSLTPADALARADDTATAVRRAGTRWRIVGWWILTAFMTVHMLGNRLFPDFLDDWTLVFLAVTMALLGGLALLARVYDRRAAQVEVWFVLGMVAVSLVAAFLYNLFIPDGITVWAFLPALLPVALCAAATARIVRG